MSTISVDLGGSHIAVAIVRNAEIFAELRCSTEAASLIRELDSIAALIRRCIAKSEVDPATLRGIAVGFCGVVDGKTGEILSTLNKYADAHAVDLHAWVRKEFSLPFRLENDTCLALLGEHSAGAARGARDVVMITLGTGIGGAAMLGGVLLRSRVGQAGCLGGHLPVNFKGRRCNCGAVGCAEAEASTSVLPLLCREYPEFRTSRLANEPLLDFKAVFRAVDHKDQVARDVLNHCIHIWSVLTVGLIHAYGPEVMIFGGGVMQQGHQLLDPIREYVEAHVWRTTRGLPRIEMTQLGERAALLGGSALFADQSEMPEDPRNREFHVKLR